MTDITLKNIINFRSVDNNKLNLVIELENTITKCCDYNKNNPNIYIMQEFKLNNNKYTIFRRPLLDDFLFRIKDKYNIYIYTLCEKIYTSNVVYNLIENQRENIFCNVFTKEDNNFRDNKKELSRINLSIDSTIILDSSKDIWLNTDFNTISMFDPVNNKNTFEYDDSLEYFYKYLCYIDNQKYNKSLKEIISNINNTEMNSLSGLYSPERDVIMANC
jgi:TFIIF-interacting CTD phosphatase-like protein